MKAQDLRIGNYVQHIHGDNIIEAVVEPHLAPKFWESINDTYEPILLTKDWLVNKFDFKDNGEGYYQHPEYNFFLFHNVEDEYFDCYKQVPANDDTGDFKTLQHVHKLQNLFYELFDEELEYIVKS